MLEKIINTVFFNKIIFKIIVVLTFFLSLVLFVRACSNYHNPYNSYVGREYDNFVSFVDENFKYDVIYWREYKFDYYTWLAEKAFVKQAIQKGIVYTDSINTYSRDLIGQVLSCDKNKIQSFKKEYEAINGIEFTNDTIGNVRVDCVKATTIPLGPEECYFIKHELWIYMLMSCICVPLIVLVLWMVLRFIIISPILWIFRKD